MEDLKVIIGNNITTLRTENKMTQYELAQRLNYSDKSVSKWERCEAVPDIYVIKQMSEIFSVSVDYLLSPHTAQRPCEHPEHKNAAADKRGGNKRTVGAIIVLGIWMLALGLFVLMWIGGSIELSVFAYALSVSLIVVLVLNSVWNKGKDNLKIISALIFGALLSVYVFFAKYNIWQIFLLLIPSLFIVFLCSRLKK